MIDIGVCQDDRGERACAPAGVERWPELRRHFDLLAQIRAALSSVHRRPSLLTATHDCVRLRTADGRARIRTIAAVAIDLRKAAAGRGA